MSSAAATDKRIRRFYQDIDDILEFVGVNWKEFYQEIDDEPPKNKIQQDGQGETGEEKLAHASTIDRLESRKSELTSATSSGDISRIENAIAWIEFDGLQAELRNEVFDGKERIRQLKGIERVRPSFQDLKKSVISEIRSYLKPPPILHTIMLCTFLLLGVGEEKCLWQWEEIRTLLRRQGRGNILYLITHFDRSDLSNERAGRVKNLLAVIDYRSASDVCEGAAIFYSWLTDMIGVRGKRTPTEDVHILV